MYNISAKFSFSSQELPVSVMYSHMCKCRIERDIISQDYKPRQFVNYNL